MKEVARAFSSPLRATFNWIFGFNEISDAMNGALRCRQLVDGVKDLNQEFSTLRLNFDALTSRGWKPNIEFVQRYDRVVDEMLKGVRNEDLEIIIASKFELRELIRFMVHLSEDRNRVREPHVR